MKPRTIPASMMERLGFELCPTGGGCRSWILETGSGIQLQLSATDAGERPGLALGDSLGCVYDPNFGLIVNLDRPIWSLPEIRMIVRAFRDPVSVLKSRTVSGNPRQLAEAFARYAFDSLQTDEPRK